MINLRKILLVSGLLITTAVQAQVDIKSQSLQMEKTEKGVKWVKATTVVPGTVIRYVYDISNDDKDIAENVEFVNHISKHMEMQENTMSCTGNCDITYSVDIKEGYKKPSNLYVIDTQTKKRRAAMAKDYVSIKVIIKTLGKNKTKTIHYESKLK